jgi:hypothetical protein
MSGRGDCLVGDIMYVSGQYTGSLGVSCVNATFQLTEDYYCTQGKVESRRSMAKCPETARLCFENQYRGKPGGAVCCSFNCTAGPIDPDSLPSDHSASGTSLSSARPVLSTTIAIIVALVAICVAM